MTVKLPESLLLANSATEWRARPAQTLPWVNGSLPEGSSGVFERRLWYRASGVPELLWGGCLKRDKGFTGSCWELLDSLATLGGAVRPLRGLKKGLGGDQKLPPCEGKGNSLLCSLKA
eukprot:s5274_g5.t2